jgi:predicted dithiol-disulfide oxidoreductase (DUF899 family)
MHPYPAPREGAEYQAARDELLKAEMALRDQREAVAAMRRALPPGPPVRDYVFREGPADLSRNGSTDFVDRKLSQLFSPGKDELIIYHFMYGPDWELGCPMCTMWIDGYNAIAPHLAQRANLALSARADLAKVRAFAATRGWRNLRILSSGGNTFTQDFGMQKGGDQLPGVSVFRRDGDGNVHHFYTGGAIMGEGEYRGLDLLSPVWHMFDLLPGGRGDFLPKHQY